MSLILPRRQLLTGAAAGVALFNIGGRARANGCRVPVGTASPNASSITNTTQTINDGAGVTYGLTSGAQVSINGTPDSTSGNVISLWWPGDGKIYHENYLGNWYARPTGRTGTWQQVATPSGPPLFWEDYAVQSSIDWTNKWWGYPQGSLQYYIDQSDPTLQADCRSATIVQSGGRGYLKNSTFPFPSDVPSWLTTKFGSNGYCAAEIVSKIAFTAPFYSVGRLKQPVSNGVMGAFWEFRISGYTKDQFEELDMVEDPGGSPRPWSQTMHFAPNNSTNVTYSYDYLPNRGAGFDATQWHIYAWEYDPQPGNCTSYFDGSQTGQFATPSTYGDPMNIWVSIYQSPGTGAWFGNTDASTIFPSQSIYDWLGVFNNKAEADAWLKARPQYSTAYGGTSGPLTTG